MHHDHDFAVHRNGDPASTWTAVKKAVQGTKMADDFIPVHVGGDVAAIDVRPRLAAVSA